MTSRPFAKNTGKTTFGNFVENKTAGDYIYNKKFKTINNCCVTNDMYFNKSNLNINLITKLDLTDVPVISNNSGESPTTLDISDNVIPYLNYRIDPSGLLFGNTVCGLYNFENYLSYNCPYTN
jgi:hypothetical protein